MEPNEVSGFRQNAINNHEKFDLILKRIMGEDLRFDLLNPTQNNQFNFNKSLSNQEYFFINH